jgi:hypothetical protein
MWWWMLDVNTDELQSLLGNLRRKFGNYLIYPQPTSISMPRYPHTKLFSDPRRIVILSGPYIQVLDTQ